LVRDKPLYSIGRKGLFEKEVNKAVLDGLADVAVHSLKDLPSDIDPRLEIVYVPPRGSPHEALVPRAGLEPPVSISLIDGGVVGTSSVRRQALLTYYNKNLKVKPIRGNLDTRLRKLDEGGYDYIVVAEVGLERLGVKRPYTRLPLEAFPPAPGQGFIAVVAPRDSRITSELKRLVDRRTWAMVIAERVFLRVAQAGCHVPLGGVSIEYGSDMLKFIGVVLSKDGARAVWFRLSDSLDRAEALGRRAGELAYSLSDRVLE